MQIISRATPNIADVHEQPRWERFALIAVTNRVFLVVLPLSL